MVSINGNIDMVSINRNIDIVSINRNIDVVSINRNVDIVSINRNIEMVSLNRNINDMISINRNIDPISINRDIDMVSVTNPSETPLIKLVQHIYTGSCHAPFALFDPFQKSLLNVLLILINFDCFGKRRKVAFFIYTKGIFKHKVFCVF
jgi:hypothetical protein